MIWTAEQKQEVASLWKSHSASEIADMFRSRGFNVTRNSIIGIANRAGCSKPRPPSKPRKQRPRKPQQIQLKVVVARTPFEPATIDLPSFNKTIGELGSADCRYIAGDPGEARYCGHPIHKHSLCYDHFKLCYVPSQPRKANPAAFTSGFRARAA